MAIRMTGLASGLDTEAIVKELMAAHSLKKEKVEKAKTKLEWKTTAWSDLNTKLVKLYNEQVTKMQLSTAYQTKKASVSDPTKANVSADTGAVNGSYSMQINNIATTQYLTGAKLGATSTSEKLADLDASLLNKEIQVTTGGKTTNVTIGADTTISDFVTSLRNAGINASYDLAQQRFFISSKESGIENAFSITSSAISAEEVAGRDAVYAAVGYENLSKADKLEVNDIIESLKTVTEGSDEYNEALDKLAELSYNDTMDNAKSIATSYVKAKLYNENYDKYYQEQLEEMKSKYYQEDGSVKASMATTYGIEYDKLTDAKKEELGVTDMTKEEYIDWKVKTKYEEAAASKAKSETTNFVNKEVTSNEDVKLEIDTAVFNGVSADEIQALDAAGREVYFGTDADAIEGFESTQGLTLESVRAGMEGAVSAYVNIETRNEALGTSALTALGLTDIVMNENGVASAAGTAPDGFAMIEASDSEIVLNGAVLTSSEATVSANGLSIELTGLTQPGETVNFSVTNDVDAVYESVKTALKEYNTLMAEMYKLYNAESAKDYEPLTSEEKEAMSDSDIELWETKIKDSLLRRDSALGSLMDNMRSAMMTTVEYDGKNYALSSFGIMTSSSNYKEGGLLHIYGDMDDATYANQEDKLKKALEEDPEAVVATLSGVFANLRHVMADKMGSKANTSSALTFYNDITMKNDMEDYKDQIEDWEDRLASMEDAYYKKFTAMEAAMAELQAQQSSLGGLFNTGA